MNADGHGWGWRLGALCAATAVAAGPLAARAQQDSGAQDSETRAGRRLLNADPEADSRLKDAARWTGEKRYEEAVRELHELQTAGPRFGLMPHPENPRLWQTVAAAAGARLAALPDEAFDLYAKRNDGAARDLLAASAGAEDETVLRRVAEGYFHTPSGGRAAARLAALAFDRGEFLTAGVLWHRLYREHRRPPADRALLLAKACVAWHAGGDTDRARRMRDQAADKHRGATVPAGGRTVAWDVFLDGLLKESVPALSPATQTVESWTSPAGSPAATAVMPACDAVPFAFWSRAEPGAESAFLDGAATAVGRLAGSLTGGRVRVTRTVPSQGTVQAMDLAPLAQPLVFDRMVLCRRDGAVVATGLDSGEELWRWDEIPLRRRDAGGPANGLHHLLPLAGDMGRHALTVADGRVFSVCKFGWVNPAGSGMAAADTWADGSSLVAFTIERGLPRPLWEVGNGNGKTEFARKARYLASPAAHGGRLYLLARLGNEYYGVCLEAATGDVMWQTVLGSVPFRGGEMVSWQQAYVLEAITERGSPAAVAGGTVFLTTNTGLVLALRADTGALLWAYQYPSLVSGLSSDPSTADLHGQAIWFATSREAYPPVNPLVVEQERVICLPCDSPHVFALNAVTGELLWQRDRERRRDLTGAGGGRVLVSGPDLALLRAATGDVLDRAAADVLGRPAVTARNVWAAGEGCLVEWDLPARRLARHPVNGADEYLGRMVIGGGMLVAANAAGMSAFADRGLAREKADERLARARGPAERADGNAKRGLLAVWTGRIEEGDAALAAALEAAATDATRGLPSVRRLRSELFVSWLRRSREADRRDAAESALRRAEASAASGDERLRVREESVRFRERFDGPPAAVQEAQRISEERPAEGDAPDAAYRLGQREVARLLREHGEGVYAAFDEAMDGARRDAAARNDGKALAAAFRQWPHAKHAGEAMCAAAGIAFREAIAASPSDAKAAGRASRRLGEVKNTMRAEAQAEAAAAQMWIDLRFRPAAARALLPAWKAGDPSSPVRFADYEGTVGDLRKRIEAAPGRSAAEDAAFAFLAPPLRVAYVVGGGPGVLLRDAEGDVVRVGDRVFLHAGSRIACLDLQQDEEPRAVLWSAEFRPEEGARRLVGQLSADGRRLLVTDSVTMVLWEACTGETVYRKRLPVLSSPREGRVSGSGDWLAIAAGSGTVACVPLASGDVLWRTTVEGLDGNLRMQEELLLAVGRDAAFCFDARTGRPLTSFRAFSSSRQCRMATLTPEGLAVNMEAGGTAAVRDVRSNAKDRADRVSLPGEGWEFLGVGSRYVALRGGTDGDLRILDLADLRRTNRLDWAGGAEGRQPMAVAFRGDRAIVLHGRSVRDALPVAPAIAAFELPSGRRIWEDALAPDNAGACRVSRLEIFGDYASLTIAPADAGGTTHSYVADAGGGRLLDAAGALPSGWRVTAAARAPVVANGRAVLECETGIVCLRVVEQE